MVTFPELCLPLLQLVSYYLSKADYPSSAWVPVGLGQFQLVLTTLVLSFFKYRLMLRICGIMGTNLTHMFFKHKHNSHILSAENRCQTCVYIHIYIYIHMYIYIYIYIYMGQSAAPGGPDRPQNQAVVCVPMLLVLIVVAIIIAISINSSSYYYSY